MSVFHHTSYRESLGVGEGSELLWIQTISSVATLFIVPLPEPYYNYYPKIMHTLMVSSHPRQVLETRHRPAEDVFCPVVLHVGNSYQLGTLSCMIPK